MLLPSFTTSKPFHIYLFIIMITICIILLWGRFDSLLGTFDPSGDVLTVNCYSQVSVPMNSYGRVNVEP